MPNGDYKRPQTELTAIIGDFHAVCYDWRHGLLAMCPTKDHAKATIVAGKPSKITYTTWRHFTIENRFPNNCSKQTKNKCQRRDTKQHLTTTGF